MSEIAAHDLRRVDLGQVVEGSTGPIGEVVDLVRTSGAGVAI